MNDARSQIGHLRLTHILDGVLHGEIIPTCNPEVGPLYAIAEFDLHKPRITGLSISPNQQGMFGSVEDPREVPIAYPKKTASWEITLEILEKILIDAKKREQEGWLAPVWLE